MHIQLGKPFPVNPEKNLGCNFRKVVFVNGEPIGHYSYDPTGAGLFYWQKYPSAVFEYESEGLLVECLPQLIQQSQEVA